MTYIDYYSEKKELLSKYRELIRSLNSNTPSSEKKMIRKAFELACEAHKDMRRKSGEPYVYHPIEVAKICLTEIGLGTTSVICALLHDVVEDTDYTLDDIRNMFGEKVAKIIDGLTKMSGVFDQHSNIQAENLRKMLLTLAEDVRTILIKLADRLHNMRTLDSMPPDKQIKIASETIYLFAPLAHRLGLYAIKTELEDLAMKYLEPEMYSAISQKLMETKEERDRYIKEFIKPIENALREKGFDFEIYGRVKSIYSIWTKMKKKQVPFEEIYDIFAIRIIINTPLEEERTDCWKVYLTVMDFYRPNPDRLRDWITSPKSNGYEALHTTVMGPGGRWVEVQIRSKRMDEIAERGYAAHWKYKEATGAQDTALDEWLRKIREMLENQDSNVFDFLDNFKLNLFSEDIYVFTPKGKLIILPMGATVIDFAYNIHTEIGDKCIGAKINQNVVGISHVLKSGDQVEIITSQKQQPQEEWLDIAITAKAKSAIKESLKKYKRTLADEGRIILQNYFKEHGIELNKNNLEKLREALNLESITDVFLETKKGNVTSKQVKEILKDTERSIWYKYLKRTIGRARLRRDKNNKSTEEVIKTVIKKSSNQVLNERESTRYKIAECCNPIPGDNIVGYINANNEIEIHQSKCPNVIQQLSKYGNKIVQTKWNNFEKITFLTGIYVRGVDEIGLVNNITNIISKEMSVNMKSIHFESNNGTFEGTLMLFVQDTRHLKKLIRELKKVNGIVHVERIDRT